MDHEIQEKNTYLINKKTKQKTIFSPAYRIRQNSGYHDKQLAFSGPTIGIGMDIMLKLTFKCELFKLFLGISCHQDFLTDLQP